MRTKFWSENLRGRGNSGDLGVDGDILECILGKHGEGVVWIHLAQDRDNWHALVKAVRKFWVP